MTGPLQYTHAFDTASSDFDRLGGHLWFPVGEATVERAAPQRGELVLDACCGNGASAIPAGRRVGSHGRVDAVDLSDALIEELRGHAADLPQVHPHRADVIAWTSGDYDLVQCVLGVFFFPDMPGGTDHLVGLLRPGGRAAITIWRRGAVEAAGQHLTEAISRVTGKEEAGPRPVHLIDRINDAAAYADWLVGRGLDDVRVTEHELRIPMTPELAWLVITGSGFVGALANLDAGQIDDVRTAYLEFLARDHVDELDCTTLVGTGTRSSSRRR